MPCPSTFTTRWSSHFTSPWAGLKAAAVTDALQGLLILFFTVLMIPLGLARIGGWHALHQAVPEVMFRLFGTVAASSCAWYSIFGITFREHGADFRPGR